VAARLHRGGLPDDAALGLWQHYIPLIAACRVLASVATRLHRVSFEYPGLQDAVGVAAAAALGTALFVPIGVLAGLAPLGADVVALDALLAGTLMLAARFTPRLWHVYRNRLSRRHGGTATTSWGFSTRTKAAGSRWSVGGRFSGASTASRIWSRNSV
jgi:hypothetical protein